MRLLLRLLHGLYFCTNSDNGFPWISAQPLLEPLLNMHTASYMSLNPYKCDDMELLHTKGHTSNPWNKCPKRGLLTTGGQIPIEKHYHSFIDAYCDGRDLTFLYIHISWLSNPGFWTWPRSRMSHFLHFFFFCQNDPYHSPLISPYIMLVKTIISNHILTGKLNTDVIFSSVDVSCHFKPNLSGIYEI